MLKKLKGDINGRTTTDNGLETDMDNDLDFAKRLQHGISVASEIRNQR